MKKFFEVVQIEKKNSLLQFYDAAKAAKKHLSKLTEHSELSNFTYMVAEKDIDAFKI